MAIVDVERRTVVPGNTHGTGSIIGRDIEDLCDEVNRSTFITDILNRPMTKKRIQELYPLHVYSYQKQNVPMQAIYEIVEIPRNQMYRRATYNKMEKDEHKEEAKAKENENKKDSIKDETKEPPPELKEPPSNLN